VYCEKGLQQLFLEKEGWEQYFKSFHTSSSELGALASKAKPKLLVLYHLMLYGASEEELLDEIRKNYSGAVVSGKDLDIY
jgi:ribonuclease BN (tRNA processing enzyme)